MRTVDLRTFSTSEVRTCSADRWDFAEVTFTDVALLIRLCVMGYMALAGLFKFTECVSCRVVSSYFIYQNIFFTKTSMTSIITHQ
jgi:hypothetical protein